MTTGIILILLFLSEEIGGIQQYRLSAYTYLRSAMLDFKSIGARPPSIHI